MLAEPMAPRLKAPRGSLPLRSAGLGLLVLSMLAEHAVAQVQPPPGDDALGIPGQQNLTLGSGARAFGMGGAFLARADDGELAPLPTLETIRWKDSAVLLTGVVASASGERSSP